MLRLYHNWLDAGSRLVRILLAEKRQEAELVLEKPWERRVGFLALNPAGTLPVLIVEGGHLAHPLAIAEYLEESFAEPAMIPGSPVERAEARRLAAWFMEKCEAEVTRLLLGEKLLKRFLRLGDTEPATLRAVAWNLKIHLDYIEHLAGRRHYLAGGGFSLADAAAAAHLSILDYFGDIPWERHMVAKDWYMRVKSRRSVRLVLADRIAGIAPPAWYDKPDF